MFGTMLYCCRLMFWIFGLMSTDCCCVSCWFGMMLLGDGDFMLRMSFGVISCVKITAEAGVMICCCCCCDAVEGTISTPLDDAALLLLLLTVRRLGTTGLMAIGTFCDWGCGWSGQKRRFTRLELVKRLGLLTLKFEKGLGLGPSKCPWILWCCFRAVPWMKRSPQMPQT